MTLSLVYHRLRRPELWKLKRYPSLGDMNSICPNRRHYRDLTQSCFCKTHVSHSNLVFHPITETTRGQDAFNLPLFGDWWQHDLEYREKRFSNHDMYELAKNKRRWLGASSYISCQPPALNKLELNSKCKSKELIYIIKWELSTSNERNKMTCHISYHSEHKHMSWDP